MTAPTELVPYFTEAASWDADRARRAARAERRAWWVAGTALVCLALTASALGALLPLKRVEPFLIRVDRSTGVVDVIPALEPRNTYDESVTRYFLTHYVLTCERFNLATAESDYAECGSFHDGRRNQEWYARWSPSNPGSPLNAHKDGSSVRAQVRSVSFFRRANGLTDLAQVRYLKAERTPDGVAEHLSYWVATVRYAWTTPSQRLEIRRWNPLGFKVLEFVAEPEADAGGSGPGAASPGTDAASAAVAGQREAKP